MLALLPAPAAKAAVFFYVATNGSDANAGTISAPFRTVAQAIAAEVAAGTNVQRVVYFRGGEYTNVTGILEGPGSGDDSSGCTFSGYGNETAILYGGQYLTGWTASSNGWWQAYLPAYPASQLNGRVNLLQNWEVRMLLVDGAMATRAQYPTDGSSLTYPNTASQNNWSYINWRNNDIPSTMIATNMEVMIDWSWDSGTVGVSSVNFGTKTINFSFPPSSQRGLQYIPDIQTYRVYNTMEGLSRPGQFYFDRSNQFVMYYPIGGKNPNASEIVVPTTDRMFYLYGWSSGIYGSHPWGITFTNLTMKVLAVDAEPEGTFGYMWDYMSLIQVSCGGGVNNLAIENCTLGWSGGNAIGSDYGYCTNVNIVNNEIGFCGNYGLAMRWGQGVVVSNNYIHDCGLITWQAPGVRVNTNAIVTQNNLFNFPESAIADWYVDNCIFTLNSISNCMQRNEDMGAYYQYEGSAAGVGVHPHGNLVASNLFQSVGTNYNVSGADPRNFYRAAIYLDELSSNTVVTGNITLNCPTPFFCNIARSNAVIGNIFINTNTPDATGYTGYIRMYASGDSTAPDFVARNIFYAAGGFVVDNAQIWGPWAGNLFWSAATIPQTNNVPAGATIANPQFTTLIGSSFMFQSNSVAPSLGIASNALVQLPLGVTSLLPPTGLHIIAVQ